MTTQQPPERYKAASDLGKPFLRLLGVSETDLERECRLVMEEYKIVHDAYLFNACKYLWRLGAKDDVSLEIVKALDYLRWFRDRCFPDLMPYWIVDYRDRVIQTITSLEAMQNQIDVVTQQHRDISVHHMIGLD